MTVFLTHSYFYQYDQKQWKNRTPYPPLGTISALALLRQNEIPTAFHDVALDPSPARCLSQMQQEKPDVVVIYDDGFNYLTKMCLTNMRHACFEMIKEAKALGATVIVSSSDSTDHYTLYHQKGADFIIHGEGEQTLIELLGALDKKENCSTITGLSHCINDTPQKTAPRVNLKNLDELPMAAWDAIDIERYRAIWAGSKFPFTLNIATTRGCPFKCNWCAKPIYGQKYNSRSPEQVVEELKFLTSNYAVKHFWVTDDIFGLKPGWVTRFNELIQQEKLDIRYKIQSRADLLMQDQYIDDLAASGLEEAWVGAESGSQKVLDAMDKGTSLEQIRTSTKLLHKKGVRVAYFLQFGYLGETKEDIAKTIRMVREDKPDDIGISVSYPLPGTKFYDRVKEQMGAKSNWEDSDDLDLMFNGTYSSDYYRTLQRYVHHLFRLQLGWEKLRGAKSHVSLRYVYLIPYNFALKQLLGAKLQFKK
jgi:anaerobic magnesium-protoporphyrin IX monomethyl ester cyclase